MSKLILEWQLNRRLEDQDIAAIIARIKARYQPLFEDPIHHAGIWHENQGLLHFDVVPREDPSVHLDNARIICLNGSPSITSDSSSDRARRFGAPLTDADAFELSRRLRDHLASGEAYGLRELALLDFFYLNEWIRRWQSAHLAINLFDKSVLPFFSIDHIKLAFAMRPLDKAERRFQRFIIAQNAEELLHVAFGNSLRFKLQDRLLRLMSRTKWLGGVLKTLSWADYLRGDGKPQIDRIFSSDTPLWQILDRERATAKWNAFLRGSDQSIQFPLRLMAFRRWYAMYSESTPGLDLPMS